MRFINALLLAMFCISFANSQIATGGDFTLEKSVIAGGGGTGSGGDFGVGSTTGQAAAGGPKTSNTFSVYSGFWVADGPTTPAGPCPLGHGYWKNNPAVWPVDSLTLGDETYTAAELLVVLNTPSGTGKKADASLILAYQLIAVKLNVASGLDPTPLGTAISDGDALLAPYPGRLPYKVASASPIGQSMVNIATTLDNFNKGLLTPGCAPPPA